MPGSIRQRKDRGIDAWELRVFVGRDARGHPKHGWADLSPKTVRGYEEFWKKYVGTSVGKRRISSLNAFEVEKVFREFKAAGASKDAVRRIRIVDDSRSGDPRGSMQELGPQIGPEIRQSGKDSSRFLGPPTFRFPR